MNSRKKNATKSTNIINTNSKENSKKVRVFDPITWSVIHLTNCMTNQFFFRLVVIQIIHYGTKVGRSTEICYAAIKNYLFPS